MNFKCIVYLFKGLKRFVNKFSYKVSEGIMQYSYAFHI